MMALIFVSQHASLCCHAVVLNACTDRSLSFILKGRWLWLYMLYPGRTGGMLSELFSFSSMAHVCVGSSFVQYEADCLRPLNKSAGTDHLLSLIIDPPAQSFYH